MTYRNYKVLEPAFYTLILFPGYEFYFNGYDVEVFSYKQKKNKKKLVPYYSEVTKKWRYKLVLKNKPRHYLQVTKNYLRKLLINENKQKFC